MNENESALRESVRLAAAEYRKAMDEYDRVKEDYRDLGPTHPDGGLALRKALQRQEVATANYRSALVALNHLILRDYKPPSGLN